jgi:hypothetical protein
MIKRAFILLCATLLTAALAGAEVTYLVGSVSVFRGGEGFTASLGSRLKGGDVVHTGDRSRTEITFDDGSLVRLSSNSDLTIERSSTSGLATSTVVSSTGGRLWSTVTPFADPASNYVVKTPTATAACRGTVFRTDVYPDTSTLLRVYDGSVEMWNPMAAIEGPMFWETEGTEGEGGTGERHEVVGPHEVAGPVEVSEEQWTQLILGGMQQLYIAPDGSVAASGEFAPDDELELDEWVTWNQERDAELGR